MEVIRSVTACISSKPVALETVIVVAGSTSEFDEFDGFEEYDVVLALTSVALSGGVMGCVWCGSSDMR